MTLVFIARSTTNKAVTKRLVLNATQNLTSATSRTVACRTLSTNSHLSSNKRPTKQHSRLKDWNIAVASGVLLVASYVTLSNNFHYLSSDTGNGSIRSLSSSSKDSQQVQSSNTQSSKLYLLTDEEVTRRLRANEESYHVNRNQGVVRYDISQLASNNPIEDDRSESIITVPLSSDGSESDFYFWGIYDGHSGPYTSSKLREELIGSVVNELGIAFKVDSENPNIRLQPDTEAIDYAIKQGFLKLDNEIVQESLHKLLKDPFVKNNVINALPASSGACGLLTFYNAASQDLKVAVTGDSRAVLGSLNDQGEWTVKSLSVDQTGDNPDEVSRILAEHPNEESTAVRNGRVLGSLQPSRAFGDFRYKLKEIDGLKIEDLPEHLKVYFRPPPKQLLTPPYVTAEPVVSTTKINPGKNDFLVIGSDGLYELLSNEEIVGLVVRWLEKNPDVHSPVKASSSASTATSINDTGKSESTTIKDSESQTSSQWTKFFKSSDSQKLPKVQDISDPKYRDIQRPAFRNKKNHSQHEYLLEDSNVSTHLIRNALSLGGSKEYVSTLVSIPSSKSRRYRDDLTVTVVFFGDQHLRTVTEPEKENGGVVVNMKGTKGGKLQEKL
ncbi:hypothetical protein WICPIJ_001639 [Wickerhamomyces pijperi]|uniref:PPM-type phosphatase domain-containing protein n=1 Tax=Wickerhamomyces pijperi TaxID=599730 RepID=A0A9P8QAE6_WICPI|nr:hypothetical protein WICPIJ_001639 [Wickerhamomyces pijperi]